MLDHSQCLGLENKNDDGQWTGMIGMGTYGHMIRIHICMRSYHRNGMHPCGIQHHIRICRLEHRSEGESNRTGQRIDSHLCIGMALAWLDFDLLIETIE